MGDTFSKRQGLGDCSGPLIFGNAPPTLRIGIWNLIEDYVNRDSPPVELPGYERLYLKLTSRFRLKRVQGGHCKNELKSMVMASLKWTDVFDLIEYLFSEVSYYIYNRQIEEWVTLPENFGTARYEYTKKINDLLSSENIGWRLRKGQLERVGSEVMDREVIERARQLLQDRAFAGPNHQFNKALNFFSKRPSPDLENCVKEAVGALEGLARILLKNKNITLGDAIKELAGKKLVRKPLDKTFHALYGFVSTEPGSRHGAYDLSSLDIPEAELVLYSSAACMLFLAKKHGISAPVEVASSSPSDGTPEGGLSDVPDSGDDIPF